ncbi:hypothetical protein B0A49_12338 [Cryomyces minteri]|uniref:PUM-HD domain-containing protein n=2 Tax=Cryomyces minteri TaxID=331657 RepID=A0A4U0XLI4_9PEZI|nr:hypothetical protein B0A49_12338 [Cryomyces minteri]
MSNASGSTRMGAGSPSKEFGSRLYSKRAREIQAQEGLAPQVWGPPTSASGHSTPLRETIPESPDNDSFPDFEPSIQESPNTQSSGRRTRAGTVPSRFSPVGAVNGLNQQSSLLPRTSRPSPSTSPFQSGLAATVDPGTIGSGSSAAANAALLSRLRAGSMPQRANFLPPSSPFGPSVFSTGWGSSRDRASTLQSIQSSNGLSSPYSSLSRDSMIDTDHKTLEYLGLIDTPQQSRAILGQSGLELLMAGQQNAAMQQQTVAELVALNALNRNANRLRSYSVNAKERYADDDEDDMSQYERYAQVYGGTSTAESTAAQAFAVQQAIDKHNQEVQAFERLASATRPRARTAGVLESPSTRLLRSYLPTPSRLENSITASDLQTMEGSEYNGLAEAVQGLQLNNKPVAETGDDGTLEGPTRALWLGNIPSSTTISSLEVIFGHYGPIESTRVLTHKNCGFVNFQNIDSAVTAKSALNNQEIFPGAGPVRIGYAKVPSASGTPGHNGAYSSPSPDICAKGQAENNASLPNNTTGVRSNGFPAEAAPAALETPSLLDIRDHIIEIVKDFGANPDEQIRVAANVDKAISFDRYEVEIPAVPEPSHNRMHDAPRLREIRKRIDNNACSQQEIEAIALEMLPEISELSSDYLGNTVVQKLFEYCSESVKEAMLSEIAPHLAEIGIHKNGTWAAQKIIDVARTPDQMKMIVGAIQPYGVAAFLDQYGNYVMQCCLRFQFPLNNFIFEVMLSQLWEVAQGRFGARAMRACLESHYATKEQQRMMAAAVALHGVQLATNANGALLLTWFLDTCTFPNRRTVLAPRLVPHLVHLCTHKVAYLTVLKIINQKNEPEARDTILQALFFSPNDRTLEDILSDQTCGATLIFKVLTTPLLGDDKMRQEIYQNVRNVLLRLKAQPAQGYRRLMDEVGLSTRNGGPRDISEGPRPSSGQSSANGRMPQQLDTQFSRQFYPVTAPQQQYDMQRSGSIDSTGFESYGMSTPVYTSDGAMGMNSVMPSQIQYQQALLAQQQAQQAAVRQNSFYSPVNVNPLNGYGGYPSPASSIDAYRNMTNPHQMTATSMSPGMLPQQVQAGFGQPAYSPMSPMMYQQYHPMHGMQGMQYTQQGQHAVGGGQRRGRR